MHRDSREKEWWWHSLGGGCLGDPEAGCSMAMAIQEGADVRLNRGILVERKGLICSSLMISL